MYASLASAQPWQWQQYQGTFWHQAPDLPPIDSEVLGDYWMRFAACGDFNGNGRDEISVSYTFYEMSPDGDPQEWNEYSFPQLLIGSGETPLYSQAVNLDSDNFDELIIYSRLEGSPFTPFIRAYDRTDESQYFELSETLLESLAFPGFPSPSMFGNFDGDTLLDGFVLTSAGLQYYERENGSWILRETFNVQPYSDFPFYLAADVNSDGDMEVGFYEPGIDCNCLWGWIFDSRNDSIFVHQYDFDVLLYPGDYDGDGNTESFMEGSELSLPSTLVRLSAGEPFAATELANQWEANSPVVFSTMTNGTNRLYGFLNGTRFQWGSWDIVPAGYTMQWSDSTWDLVGDGSWYGNVYEGNTADMDSDGDKEYIYRMLAADWFGPDRVVWSIGSGNLERFFDNPDTLFTNPRIGDVEGDGVGELVTRVASGAPVGLYFYELERVGTVIVAHHKPYLSEDLPTNITEFTLADIDNDGQAELFINTGFWRVFFWRNQHWDEYTGILPTGIGLNLYFADFDGDGDLDVFSQNGVWISLTPSAADDPVATPSSFKLSSYPNPFNAQTTITFDLPRAGEVTLTLFDVLGREVETLLHEKMNAGSYALNYSASALPSGVYFIRFVSNEINATHKLLLLK